MTNDKSISIQRGLYFEEFEIGQSLISEGRTVTEADIVAFAALSGDWTTIHTDAEYAAQHSFGQRVAHGMLVVSIASGLLVRTGVIEGTALAFREINSWKFSLPVFIGDTVRVPPLDDFEAPEVYVQVLDAEGTVVARSSNLQERMLPVK